MPQRSSDVSGRAPERRVHHRVLVARSAWLVGADKRWSAECVDVSMGGAALRTEAGLSEGAVVNLELYLGFNRGSVAILGEVVRSSQRELGVRFLTLNRASLEGLLTLL